MPRLCRKVSTAVGRSPCSECGPVMVGGVGRREGVAEGGCEREGGKVGEVVWGEEERDFSHCHSSLGVT